MTLHRPHITVDAVDPAERGRQRGTQLREILERSFARYLELFEVSGRTASEVEDDARRTIDAIAAWQSRYVEEIDGVASAAGMEPWQIAALNARTEILAAGLGATAQECSTIAKRVRDGDRVVTFSIQTWDWHVELDDFWHTHETRGFGHSVVGFTEAGILGKAGMNSAGLGTHFNILGHANDGAGGVPMHVLATAMLEQCASIEEGLEFIRRAPISASSAFTMVEEGNAVSVELSPAGIFVVPMDNDRVIRTNHFLTATPRRDEKSEVYEPDSSERMELIQSRFARYPEPKRAEELLEFLYSDEGQPPLCAVPDMTKPFGERWATLATLILSPADRTAQIAAGSPIDARAGSWLTLTAA